MADSGGAQAVPVAWTDAEGRIGRRNNAWRERYGNGELVFELFGPELRAVWPAADGEAVTVVYDRAERPVLLGIARHLDRVLLMICGAATTARAAACAGRFLRAIAHDANNAVHVLGNIVEELADDLGTTPGVADETLEALDDLRQAVRALTDLMGQAQTFGRSLTVTPGVVDLAALTDEIAAELETLRPDLPPAEVELPGGSCGVIGLLAPLRQCLRELTLVALPRTLPPRLGVTPLPDVGRTEWWVATTPEAAARALEALGADALERRHGSGSLGLWVGGRLLESLGASAWCATADGETRLVVSLTTATAAAATPAAAAAHSLPAPPPARLVIVDDEPLVRTCLARTLAGRGHQCETFGSGEAALARLLGDGPPVQALVLDVMLPDRRGDEVLAALREAGSQLPVIAVTGYAEGEVIDRLQALGCVAVLRKPFPEVELLAALSRALAG